MNRVVLYNEQGTALVVLSNATVQCTSALNEVGSATIETDELTPTVVNTICEYSASFIRVFFAQSSFATDPQTVIWSGFVTGATVRREPARTVTTITAIGAEDFLRRRFVLFPKGTTPDNQYRWYANGTAFGTIVNGLLRNYQSYSQRYLSNPFPFPIISDVQTTVTVPEIDTGERTPYEVLRAIIGRYGTYFKAVIEGTNSIRLIVRTLFAFPAPVTVLTPTVPFVSEYREDWAATDEGALIVWYGGSSTPFQAASSYSLTARERLYRANSNNQGEAAFEAVSSLDPYPSKRRVVSVSLTGQFPRELLITGNAVALKNEFGFGNRALIRSVTYRSQNGVDNATIELTDRL